MNPRFSLVVPAYNESELLPRLLGTIDVARRSYRGGGDAIEVIVADNGSTDDTAAIARAAGCRVAPVTERCIAAARNGGAALARGEVVCFVDADCVIHPETFSVIDDGLGVDVVGGSTGVHPERWSLGLRVTYGVLFAMLWLFQMDGGVVFCRRSDFEALGGYNDKRLFAEDVEFLVALRRLGRRRSPRQRLVRLQGARTYASNRKFDKYGQWHMLTSALRHSVLLFVRPEKTTAFARRYWYEDR